MNTPRSPRKPGHERLITALVASPAFPLAPAALAPFFGRADELARALERLRRQRVVGIVGPAGSGKTALAAQIIQADGASALWVTLGEGLGNPVEDLIWQLARPLLARHPDLFAAVGQGPLPAIARIQALLGHYAQGPLTICVDLLDPLGPPGAQILSSLADYVARATDLPIRLILAGRALPHRVLPYTLDPLAGLSPADIGAWAAFLGLRLDAEQLALIAAQTGGLPLALATLFASPDLGRPQPLSRLMLLPRLRSLVAGLLGQLSVGEQRLIADLALAAGRAGPPSPELAPQIEALERQHLIQRGADGITPLPLFQSYIRQLYGV